MAETTRITSLNMLLDQTGKMLLAEEYGKVIENVQKKVELLERKVLYFIL